MMMTMVMMKIKKYTCHACESSAGGVFCLFLFSMKTPPRVFVYRLKGQNDISFKAPLLTLGLKGLNLARHYDYTKATLRASTKQTASSAA